MVNSLTYQRLTLVLLLGIICLLVRCNIPPSEPENITYANKLSENESLAKYSDYFKKEYANYTKDEPYWAYRSILFAHRLNLYYEKNIELKKGKTQRLIDEIDLDKALFNECLNNYSETWSLTIKRHVEYERLYIDFSTALAIQIKEYSRMGVFVNFTALKDGIKEQLKNLPKEKYPKTLELYSILSQLFSLTENPTGSLQSFNETISNLNSEFVKIKSLAELEY